MNPVKAGILKINTAFLILKYKINEQRRLLIEYQFKKMTQEIIISSTDVSFKDFLFKNKRNRTTLWLAAIAIVTQFSLFKYFYPFASYIHGDSFAYLKAASENLNLNTYLIGYSKFLRLFSVFSKSDLGLTAFQYLFIQSGVLFLLFTLFYLYTPGKIIQIFLLCFMVFNPLFLHIANLISSDGIFLALSMIWFSLLLWVLSRPSKSILIWHALVLFIAFTVRYNAIIYPFISTCVFLMANISIRNKIFGLSIAFLLCGFFIISTSYQYKKLTGHWQYSPFSGWQIANNAMYAYRYVDSANRKSVPIKFYTLDKMIREFFDSTHDTKRFPSEAAMASTFYMWSPWMPLMKYRNSLFKKDTSLSELKRWATMGPYYKEYGIYQIKQYPWHFLRYFIWPNANKYYAPPVEFLANYNSGKNYVNPTTKNWFAYKSENITTRTRNNKVWILDFYPILSGVVNVVMLFSLVCYCILKGWQLSPFFNKGIILSGSFWLLNAGFTIVASSAALRFQSFPIILTTTISCLLIDWLSQLASGVETNSLKSEIKVLESELSV